MLTTYMFQIIWSIRQPILFRYASFELTPLVVYVKVLPSSFHYGVSEVASVVYDVRKPNAIVPERQTIFPQSLLELVTVDFAKTDFWLNIRDSVICQTEWIINGFTIIDEPDFPEVLVILRDHNWSGSPIAFGTKKQNGYRTTQVYLVYNLGRGGVSFEFRSFDCGAQNTRGHTSWSIVQWLDQ